MLAIIFLEYRSLIVIESIIISDNFTFSTKVGHLFTLSIVDVAGQ